MWQPLFDRLIRLRATWPGQPWTWDARFSAVASTFVAEQEPEVRASAMLAFPRGWTAKSLEAAPELFRSLAERTGGLRAGQRLLGGDELTCPTLYGLWWPWAGGDKATLRIGSFDAAPIADVRILFGV